MPIKVSTLCLLLQVLFGDIKAPKINFNIDRLSCMKLVTAVQIVFELGDNFTANIPFFGFFKYKGSKRERTKAIITLI